MKHRLHTALAFVFAFVFHTSAGASLDEQLFDAAWIGDAETIVALQAAGAKPNARSNDGWTPLHSAVSNGHIETIAALLSSTANPNSPSNNGQTPLHQAAQQGHAEAIVALLTADADPNARDNGGWTPLHYAASEGYTEAITALQAAGAALNAQNNDEQTPLDLAVQLNHVDVISSLHAVPIPEETIGIWTDSECGGSGDTYLFNSSRAMIVHSSERNFALAVVPVEWAAGAVVVSQADGVVVLPTENLRQCSALPALSYVGFGEVIALFQAFDGIRVLCNDDTPLSCATAVFSTVDISDDQRISEAELARVVRAGSVLLTYEILAAEQKKDPADDGLSSSFVPAEKLYSAVAITVLGGPIVIGNLVRSYDYDGDGFLSLEEIMQDRLPRDMAGIAQGLASAGIAEAGTSMVRNAPNLMGPLEALLRGAF